MVDIFGLRAIMIFGALGVGFFNLMQGYLLLIMIDFVFGIVRSGYQGRLKSKSMQKGIWVSVAEFVLVLGCGCIVGIFPSIEGLVSFLIMSLILKELTSINENWKAMGKTIPKCIDKLLDQENDKFGNKRFKDEDK